jgi:hypothetical protein
LFEYLRVNTAGKPGLDKGTFDQVEIIGDNVAGTLTVFQPDEKILARVFS